MITSQQRAEIESGARQPTLEEIKQMRRLVYKSLVDTNQAWVENRLRERIKGLIATIMYFDRIPEEDANFVP